MNGYKNGFVTHSQGHTITSEDVQDAADYLRERTKYRPTIGIVCGSGLGGLADSISDRDTFSYKDILHFPLSTVPGHAGRLVFGMLAGKSVVCMQGRTHGYEGYTMQKITFPIRVFKELGVEVLVVTNASGGLNPKFKLGDVMIIKDHINLPGLAGLNPLVGQTDQKFGPRFVALSDAYDKDIREVAKEAAEELNFDFVQEGVYSIQVGPCFETVAECNMLRLLGADVTGMSSVPEVIVARQLGVRVVGLSLVTNMCVTQYDTDQVANHEEVLETGRMRAKDMEKLVYTIVDRVKVTST